MEYADISLKMNARKEITANLNTNKTRPNQANTKQSYASISWRRIIVNIKTSVRMLMEKGS
jgi:hypothetical protein